MKNRKTDGNKKMVPVKERLNQGETSISRFLLRWGSIGCLSVLMAACASTPPQQRQQIPIAQEVAHYQARARSYYTPPGPPEDPWGPYIREASARFDVPEIWIRAVMQQESGGSLYHNGQLVTSGPGAMGLMQLMPPTYDEMKIAYNLGDDAYDPHDNIMAGTAYIRQMYDIYGSPGFLAAYNGGPGRLDDFLTRNRALPLETRRYVAAIGVQIQGIKPNRQSQADLLVEGHERGGQVNAAQYASAATPLSRQPVILSADAQSVQQAWNNRQNMNGQNMDSQNADSLNSASLNGVSSATTDTLNQQSLQVSDGKASNGQGRKNRTVRLASAATTYPVQWKRFDPQPAASGNESQQDISSAWAARGFQQTAPAVQENPPVVQQPIEVASLPAAPVRSSQYYRPVSYQFPAASRKVTTPVTTVRKPVVAEKKNRNSSIASESRAATGKWGIQVGAYASVSQAHMAAGKAQSKAALHSGVQQVQIVQKGKGKIYRARVTGLSEAAAQNACRKLSSCMLIRPSASNS